MAYKIDPITGLRPKSGGRKAGTPNQTTRFVAELVCESYLSSYRKSPKMRQPLNRYPAVVPYLNGRWWFPQDAKKTGIEESFPVEGNKSTLDGKEP